MIDTLGWTHMPTEEEMKKFSISFYGQSSIVRWLTDDTKGRNGQNSSDVTVRASMDACGCLATCSVLTAPSAAGLTCSSGDSQLSQVDINEGGGSSHLHVHLRRCHRFRDAIIQGPRVNYKTLLIISK